MPELCISLSIFFFLKETKTPRFHPDIQTPRQNEHVKVTLKNLPSFANHRQKPLMDIELRIHIEIRSEYIHYLQVTCLHLRLAGNPRLLFLVLKM